VFLFQGAVQDAAIDAALRKDGIICNYSGEQWTGVSMARYRKIVRLLVAEDKMGSVNHDGLNTSALTTLLAFLWEKSVTKQCLLDYYLAIERASGVGVLQDTYSDLRVPGSEMHREWIASRFETADLTRQRVETALTGLNTRPQASTDEVDSAADALDLVAATYALERSFKAPIKLGRYSYRGGRPRPDCVEVVVREIIDSLIFGKHDSAHTLMYMVLFTVCKMPVGFSLVVVPVLWAVTLPPSHDDVHYALLRSRH
jgi:hypothetical protein